MFVSAAASAVELYEKIIMFECTAKKKTTKTNETKKTYVPFSRGKYATAGRMQLFLKLGEKAV